MLSRKQVLYNTVYTTVNCRCTCCYGEPHSSDCMLSRFFIVPLPPVQVIETEIEKLTHTYVCVHTHTHMYVYIHTYTHIYIYVCVCVYTHAHTHIYAYGCVYTNTHVSVRARTRVRFDIGMSKVRDTSLSHYVFSNNLVQLLVYCRCICSSGNPNSIYCMLSPLSLWPHLKYK